MSAAYDIDKLLEAIEPELRAKYLEWAPTDWHGGVLNLRGMTAAEVIAEDRAKRSKR